MEGAAGRATTFSVAYSSATNRADSLQIWHMYAVAQGKFSECDIVTFQLIREVT